MKKQIVLATIATLATGSVYATKARMNALGQDQDRGSFYIDDTRNVFRNAARINKTNNYVVTEWGDATAAGGASTPKAEGGFFRSAGSFNYGLYLGSDITDQGGDTALAGYADSLAGTTTGPVFGETGFKGRSNDLDLFFGGDAGVEWGGRLHYANGSQEQVAGSSKKEQSTLELGLGMVMGDLNAYVNYVLNDEHKVGDNNADKFEDDGSMNIGVGYNWMDFTFYVDYKKQGAKYTNATAAANTTDQTVLNIGAGYIKEVSSTSRMFTDFGFRMTDAEDKDGTTATNNLEASRSELPLTVGFETDATSWLTLRGSIGQNIVVNSQKTKAGSAAELSGTRDNTTNVNAGATLNFGKLMIDGTIGTNGTTGAASGTKSGALDLDRLMTQVAVHYWF
ncbi:MAG: hypothetical protein K9K67_00400 [Bacteriovoracaceae bacterium]|nr:hypothetical protein [Bacteriovoracaceae bacterium]